MDIEALAGLLRTNPFSKEYRQLRGDLIASAGLPPTARRPSSSTLAQALRIHAERDPDPDRRDLANALGAYFRWASEVEPGKDEISHDERTKLNTKLDEAFPGRWLETLRRIGLDGSQSHTPQGDEHPAPDAPPDDERTAVGRLVGFRYVYRRIRDEVLGESPAANRLREQLWNAVFTSRLEIYPDLVRSRQLRKRSPLLIGEAGTGKSHLARVLGHCFLVASQPGCTAEELREDRVITANLAELPESLFESELFGHAKGAFTGARRASNGILGNADAEQVVFIDEVTEVPKHLQLKLLRLLEERVYHRVGEVKERQFEGRFLFASNRPYESLWNDPDLRADFLSRICRTQIEVPPLRELLASRDRTGTLRALTEKFYCSFLGLDLDDSKTRNRPRHRKTIAAIVEALETKADQEAPRPWPGNVRQFLDDVHSLVTDSRPSPPRRPCVDEARGERQDEWTILQRLLGSQEPTEGLRNYQSMLARFARRSEVPVPATAALIGCDPRTLRGWMAKLPDPGQDSL